MQASRVLDLQHKGGKLVVPPTIEFDATRPTKKLDLKGLPSNCFTDQFLNDILAMLFVAIELGCGHDILGSTLYLCKRHLALFEMVKTCCKLARVGLKIAVGAPPGRPKLMETFSPHNTLIISDGVLAIFNDGRPGAKEFRRLLRAKGGKNEKDVHLGDVSTIHTFRDLPLILIICVAQALSELQN